MIGRVLGDRYQLTEFIGKGGMALVFKAEDMRTGHDVAVKILRPEYNQDAEFVSRFQREATAASKMSHHNIVNLLDIGEDGEYRYLVLEYVKGKTLKDIISQMGPLPPQVAAQIALRILSALKHAHQSGIIHRDIKPQNILVHSEGHIKVSDFGIARVAGSGTISKTDSVMGSVHYFSPEQAKGEDVTFASDLYSVGVVLYEMLSGRVPFDGDTPVSVALQHINQKPRPLSDFVQGVPPALESVVMKALAKKPENRYQSAVDMARDIQRAMAVPGGDVTREVKDKPIPLISQITARQRPVRKRAGWKSALIILLSVGVLFGLFEAGLAIYNGVVNSVEAPYLLGGTEEEAQRAAQRLNLKLEITRVTDDSAAGTVLLQTPDEGDTMRKGDTLLLTVSLGPEEKAVPALLGKSAEEAASELEKMGFYLLVVERTLSQKPAGMVLTQSPSADEMLPVGGIVQVTLSGGQVSMPTLTGLARENAEALIAQSRLTLSEVRQIVVTDESRAGQVAAQLPDPGALVIEGTDVTLAVYVLEAEAAP